jgi:hypothetical protein
VNSKGKNFFFLLLSSELSIPPLNSILKRDEEKLNLFRTLKIKQIQLEEHALQRAHLINNKPLPECKPPE